MKDNSLQQTDFQRINTKTNFGRTFSMMKKPPLDKRPSTAILNPLDKRPSTATLLLEIPQLKAKTHELSAPEKEDHPFST